MPHTSTNIMAQIVQIPILFEFRTVKIKWEETCADITGWWWNDGQEKGASLHLTAELRQTSGKNKVRIPVGRLPERERKECLAVRGKRHSDEMVKEICSSLQLQYFVHNCKTYFGGELKRNSLPNDAWQMRDEFLSLKGDTQKTIAFLNSWGRWRPLLNYVDVSEVFSLQAAVKTSCTAPEKWFATVGFPTMTNYQSSEFPYLSMLTDACEVAIRMTMTIDLLHKIEFRNCARWDCDKPFPVTSKRKKAYCSQYCAHLESVRRGRAAQRSA